jgi:hypothetical protein
MRKEEGSTVLTDLQAYFHQIIEQDKKHKQALRHEGEWHHGTPKTASIEIPKRKLPKPGSPLPVAPSDTSHHSLEPHIGPMNEASMLDRLTKEGYHVHLYEYPVGTSFPRHTHAVDK